MMTDSLGDKLKALEGVEAKRAAVKGMPLVARLDGRSFHTFTRGLQRPFDERLSDLMIKSAAALVHELGARIGYTQSDEVTLAWYYSIDSPSDYPFSGRYQKLCSVLASCMTAHFVKALPSAIPEKAHLTPQFDCRVWQTSIEDAYLTFKWREADARKNAISMAASSYFPHRELQSVPSSERLKMLEVSGVTGLGCLLSSSTGHM
jgi:tRNA(His) 5'-end guanylyltransferase